MTDDEKASATRIAEAALPIFLARELNAGDGKHAHQNAWTVAEMFITARRQYITTQDTKDAQDLAARDVGADYIAPSADPRNLTKEEKALISGHGNFSGGKIKAIKMIRERTGCTLMDAKSAADDYSPIPF